MSTLEQVQKHLCLQRLEEVQFLFQTYVGNSICFHRLDELQSLSSLGGVLWAWNIWAGCRCHHPLHLKHKEKQRLSLDVVARLLVWDGEDLSADFSSCFAMWKKKHLVGELGYPSCVEKMHNILLSFVSSCMLRWLPAQPFVFHRSVWRYFCSMCCMKKESVYLKAVESSYLYPCVNLSTLHPWYESQPQLPKWKTSRCVVIIA